MLKIFCAFLANTKGVTGIEYGLLLGGIALTVGTGAAIFGEQFAGVFEELSSYMDRGTSLQ